ncbi:MAG: hypothetical protein MUF47_02260 [Porphyrobacter sp.]|nr:hypothetical protein [Porphyrobacter sp.]
MIALGRLTCAWGAIEQRLFDLYSFIAITDSTVHTEFDAQTGEPIFRFGSNQGEFIASSFGALDSNRARRDVVLSTAKGQRDKGHFTTDEFQEISKLIDGVTSLAKQRNKLAHAAFEFQQGGAYYFGTDTYLANFRGGAPRQKCQPRNVEEVTSRLLALDA